MTEPKTETETETSTSEMQEKKDFALVIHGGAGTILKENMTPEKEKAYRDKLKESLMAGYEVLNNGGSSIEAVEAAIVIMEDSELFNAGKGAVFTNAETNELDASFMDGATLNAGAVGGVKKIKNPIQAARAVLEHSPHVFLAGEGADQFAEEQGLELVEQDYFYTKRRWDAVQNAKAKDKTGWLDPESEVDHKFGTVGAIALDKNGNIAAGTSTGGRTNKQYGRIGDSPIIGAGTYANNATCGVSSTGHGEFFMRYVVAYDISALMEYQDMSLDDAAELVVNKKLKDAGGSGGVVALDKYGNVAMPHNTPGMYRGYIHPDGEAKVLIYKEE
ncbi:MAG: isoaspartyl peptidase/L-asparaginase [Bacteroidota bacterium]